MLFIPLASPAVALDVGPFALTGAPSLEIIASGGDARPAVDPAWVAVRLDLAAAAYTETGLAWGAEASLQAGTIPDVAVQPVDRAVAYAGLLYGRVEAGLADGVGARLLPGVPRVGLGQIAGRAADRAGGEALLTPLAQQSLLGLGASFVSARIAGVQAGLSVTLDPDYDTLDGLEPDRANLLGAGPGLGPVTALALRYEHEAWTVGLGAATANARRPGRSTVQALSLSGQWQGEGWQAGGSVVRQGAGNQAFGQGWEVSGGVGHDVGPVQIAASAAWQHGERRDGWLAGLGAAGPVAGPVGWSADLVHTAPAVGHEATVLMAALAVHF